MTPNNSELLLTDLADGALEGPEWEAWQAAHPAEAEQVRIARQVRLLMRRLQAAEVTVPEGFEERLMARIREDRTLLDLIDLGLTGLGRTLIELLNLLFSLLPAPQPAPTAA